MRDADFVYSQEKRLHDFLEQGVRQKHDFMHKLEEEKKFDEFEEEEKFSEASELDEEEEGTDQANSFKLDQIAFQLTQSLLFAQMPRWEQYKQSFLSVILCTVAGMKEGLTQVKPQALQSEFASGKRVLSI